MKSQIFSVDDRSAVIEALCSGKIGILATDTVYGLVCRAQDELAGTRLYAAKHRHHKPGTVIAASLEQLTELGLKRAYLKAAEEFWPNPISVIVPCGEALAYLHIGKRSLAVRVPASVELRELLEQTGPLLTTSANLPGSPVATTVQEAAEYFGDTVDFYVDSGEVSDYQPSTVIQIIDDAIEVLRQGAVTMDENGRMSER